MQHGEAGLGAAEEADGVRVRVHGADYPLAVAQALHGADAVAQRGGDLEPELLSRGLHLGGETLRELFCASGEHQLGLCYRGAVLFRRRPAGAAPAGAGAHMVIEAGPRLVYVAREAARTGGQLEGLAHGVYYVLCQAPPSKGAEILGAVLNHAVRQREARVLALHVQADEGIALVVLEQDVVVRLVALYERVFQHQRLEFALDYDDVEVVHLGHHGRDLGQVFAAEIACHAVFERLGLAHVYDLAADVLHYIHAGQQRQAVGLVAQFVCFRRWTPPCGLRRSLRPSAN